MKKIYTDSFSVTETEVEIKRGAFGESPGDGVIPHDVNIGDISLWTNATTFKFLGNHPDSDWVLVPTYSFTVEDLHTGGATLGYVKSNNGTITMYIAVKEA